MQLLPPSPKKSFNSFARPPKETKNKGNGNNTLLPHLLLIKHFQFIKMQTRMIRIKEAMARPWYIQHITSMKNISSQRDLEIASYEF